MIVFGRRIYLLLNRLTERLRRMEQELQRLTQEVQRNSDAVLSATELLNRLAQLIRDSADNPDQVRQLADQLQSQTDALAAAVATNTPADPNA